MLGSQLVALFREAIEPLGGMIYRYFPIAATKDTMSKTTYRRVYLKLVVPEVSDREAEQRRGSSSGKPRAHIFNCKCETESKLKMMAV